jgi:HEAT repeat protein
MPATALEALAGSLGPEAPANQVIRALEVLEQVTPESLAPRAIELTSHRVPDVRRAALRVTARIGGPRADQILLKALGDVHLGVQEEAIELLVAKGGERMVDTFIGLLSLPNSLRFRVIRALGRLGVPRASAKLEALSRDCALHERLEIIVALTRIQPPSLRDFLQRELGDANVEIRRAAARGFGVIAEVQDLPVLTRLALDDDWTLRNEAARGLGHLPPAQSEQLLLDLARDTESVVARSARQVLANRRDRDVAGAA